MMGDGLFASKDDYPRQTLNVDLDSVAKLSQPYRWQTKLQ